MKQTADTSANSCKLKPAVRDAQARNALVVQYLDVVPWAIYHAKPSLKRQARILGHAEAN
jgi:hypothetical protein